MFKVLIGLEVHDIDVDTEKMLRRDVYELNVDS